LKISLACICRRPGTIFREAMKCQQEEPESFLFPTIRSAIIANEVRNDLGTKHHRELSWLNNLLLKHVPMVDSHIQKILQQEQQSHAPARGAQTKL
jgi:hypothetical protein